MGNWWSTSQEENVEQVSPGPLNDISKILDDGTLYLSSHGMARNYDFLNELGITHIVSITKEDPLHFPEKITYLHLPYSDSSAAQISNEFQNVVEFIDNARKDNFRVLVHCEAGVSRSATLIMAYLLGTSSADRIYLVKDAHKFVKSRRKIIQPNFGFIKQLLHYSEKGLGNTEEPLFFAEYLIGMFTLDKEGVTAEKLAPLLEQHPDDIMLALNLAIENK